MRKSIYVDNEMASLLELHENASGRLQIVAARYTEILRRHCPALSEAQWNTIFDVFNGHFHSAADDSRSVLLLLEDGDEFEGLGNKWQVDIPDLCRELKAAGAAGMFAVTEVAQQFWLSHKSDGPVTDIAKFVRSKGARIRP